MALFTKQYKILLPVAGRGTGLKQLDHTDCETPAAPRRLVRADQVGFVEAQDSKPRLEFESAVPTFALLPFCCSAAYVSTCKSLLNFSL